MLAQVKITPQHIARLVALLAVIAISVYVYSIRDQAEELAVLGYPGIFVLALLSYATVLLPAPATLVIFTMGAVLHPALVGLVAGAGAALGELSGYMAGYSGQAVLERSAIYERMVRMMSRAGPITIVLLAALPNPFFDLAGVAAGALKVPVRRFFVWVWVGETLKMLFLAYFGSSLPLIFR
jgi:membrane protein YqaA with SNARE-associated domain